MNPLFQKFLVQRRMEYLTVDEELKILATSSGVRRFADAPDEVSAGKDVREAFPELFGMEEYLEAVMAGRKDSVDLKGVARFSEPITPLYFDIHIMANEEENEQRLIVFFEDVTSHMVMKQNLVQRSNQANLLLNTVESSMAYIDKIISSMADAMVVTTAPGHIKTVNPAAVKLFGYGEKELIGQPIDLIFEAADLWQKLNADEQLKNVEVRCRAKNGNELDVAFSCAVIYSDLEESENFIYIGRDISERKRMEAEIQKANENLTLYVNKLESRNREITRLSELSHLLQGCRTLKEAYGVIGERVKPLFPNLVGGVFAVSESKHMVETIATWGNPGINRNLLSTNSDNLPPPNTREVVDGLSQVLCRYMHPDSPPAEYYWVPMMTAEEMIGLLYLSAPEAGLLTEAKQQLAMTVAEHIGLALGNLKLRETLKNQSIKDPLTGLYNRRYMEETVTREIQQAALEGRTLGIIILDIDYFKRFNDTFGHLAGDTVLKTVGEFLQQNIQRKDLACRYGGEEFIIMMRETQLDEAKKRSELLRLGVKSLPVEHGGQNLGCITISLGVACFPQHGSTLEELINAADAALYRAKAQGRDRSEVAAEIDVLPIRPVKEAIGSEPTEKSCRDSNATNEIEYLTSDSYKGRI